MHYIVTSGQKNHETADMNVVGIEPQPFVIGNGASVTVNKHQMSYITTIIEDDFTFIYLLAALDNLAQNHGCADVPWFDLRCHDDQQDD